MLDRLEYSYSYSYSYSWLAGSFQIMKLKILQSLRYLQAPRITITENVKVTRAVVTKHPTVSLVSMISKEPARQPGSQL